MIGGELHLAITNLTPYVYRSSLANPKPRKSAKADHFTCFLRLYPGVNRFANSHCNWAHDCSHNANARRHLALAIRAVAQAAQHCLQRLMDKVAVSLIAQKVYHLGGHSLAVLPLLVQCLNLQRVCSFSCSIKLIGATLHSLL